ncbi:MAG: hypothetical protein DHS20C18_19370 [Saprospiraceae bacterium]|nr:MAG: hypothetical protein DHS20C18_19370 [Saprospiraceae bacterium]
MTDVPFMVLGIVMIYLYNKAFDGGGEKYWWLATILAAVTVLLRQFALLWPLAFGVAWVLRHRNWRAVLSAGVGILLCWITLKAFSQYLELNNLLSPTFGSLSDLLRSLTLNFFQYRLKEDGGMILFNCAVFILPALVIVFRMRRKRHLVLLFLSSLIVFYAGQKGWNNLLVGNVFFNTGLGPLTLPSDNEKWFHEALIPDGIIKVFGLFGATILIQYLAIKALDNFHLWRQWPTKKWWKIGLFFLSLGICFFILFDNYQFDRYFLPIAVILLLLFNPDPEPRRIKKIVAIALLGIMAIFSITATHDYMQWNETRWKVLRQLMETEGIPPENIDGGFEFNAWYKTGPRNPFIKGNKSWWFVREDEYAVSFGPYGCYQIEENYIYHSLLKPWGDTLYLLHRPTLIQTDTILCDLEQMSTDSAFFLSKDRSHFFEINTPPVTGTTHSGQNALRLTPEQPYALSTYISPVQPCEQLTFTLWNYGKPKVNIIATTPDQQSFSSTSTAFTDRNEQAWERIRFEVTLPPDYPSDSLKVFLWNRTGKEVLVDDFEVVWKHLPN